MCIIMESSLVQQHLISLDYLSKTQMEGLFQKAQELSDLSIEQTGELLRNKILAVMFFQPSTRTRLSFETAMLKLGGRIIGFQDFKTTRAGDFFQETLADTVRVVAQMADAMVIRHFKSQACEEAASISSIPVINAGDGANEHPTQALSDIWLLSKIKGELVNLNIGLVGDIDNRSLYAILIGLIKFPIKKIFLLLPPNKKVSLRVKDTLEKNNIMYVTCNSMDDILYNVDCILMIPFIVPEFEKPHIEPTGRKFQLDDKFILNKKRFLKAGRKIPILHTGPRGPELSTDMDELQEFMFFSQVKESVFMRMAILHSLVGE